MQAKEAGLGYWAEKEGTLHLVPAPIIRINSALQWHSDRVPAIEWKGGRKFYFLNGVSFPEALWKRATSREMPMSEILAIEDVDQRTQALKYGSFDEFSKMEGARMLDRHAKIAADGQEVPYELWEFPKGKTFVNDVHFMRYTCPSTRQEYVSGVFPAKTCAEAMARKEGIDADTWLLKIPLVHES